MTKTLKFPCTQYVRLDTDTLSKLIEVSAKLETQPAVLSRSLIVGALNKMKGDKDVANIKIIK